MSSYSMDESGVLSFKEREDGYRVTYVYVDDTDDLVADPRQIRHRRTTVPRLFKYEETENGYRIIHVNQRRLGGEEALELLPDATIEEAMERCGEYAKAYARDGELDDVYEQIRDTDTQSVNLIDREQ